MRILSDSAVDVDSIKKLEARITELEDMAEDHATALEQQAEAFIKRHKTMSLVLGIVLVFDVLSDIYRLVF